MYNLPTDELLSLGISAITLITLLSISMIAFRVFIVLAIHFNAKSLAVKDEVPWLVLAAFFPLVVGVVYLCCRKSLSKTVPKYCPRCGATYPNNQVYCPACNSTDLVECQVENKAKHKKNSRIMLVLSIIMAIVSVVSLVQLSVKITKYIVDYSDDVTSFFDEFDDYDNYDDYDFDYDYGFDYDDFFN